MHLAVPWEWVRLCFCVFPRVLRDPSVSTDLWPKTETTRSGPKASRAGHHKYLTETGNRA